MADESKISVLIVDDIAETLENIRKLLQFESDVDVVGTARSGREAIQRSEELSPHVVIMDINMPDMDGIAATEAIRAKLPHVQIVILSVQGDPNYMRRAMQAGASDFLTKPPMGDELISAIRRAGAMARQERAKVAQAPAAMVSGRAGAPSGIAAMGMPGLSQGKIVTVYSPKGGIGCTTVAVNLALSLHNEDTPVAIVDGNLQFGDVAVFVNEQGKNNIVDLAPRAEELEPEFVSEVMVKHSASGMHILAAPPRPEHAEKVTGEQFGKVLQYLRQIYAYVVVDTTTALNDVTLEAIDQCDALILLTTQEIPSIKSCRLFLDLLQTLGIERERVVFAINRFDKRIGITPEKIAENLKQEVVAVIPLEEATVVPAVNRGIPFMIEKRATPVGRGILQLAEKVRAALTAEVDDASRAPKR